MNMRKMLTGALACAMALSMSVPAMAIDMPITPSNDISVEANNDTGTVPVKVTTDEAGLTFKVTMPASLPIAVDKDGNVFTAENVKITNESAGAVEVSDMTIAGANSWETVDYDANFGQYGVNATKIGMVINEQKTTGADTIAFDATKFVNDNSDQYMWAGIGDSVGSAENNTMAVRYDAKLAPQATALNDQTVANVVFTVGWYAG